MVLQMVTSVQKISLAVSTYHFLGIALDRLLAISRPFTYRQDIGGGRRIGGYEDRRIGG
jgi:hypothetical protein